MKLPGSPITRKILLAAACLAGIQSAHGIAISIPNGSFEDPNVDGSDFNLSITDWGQGTDTGVVNGGAGGAGSPPPATDGEQVAFLGNGTDFTNIFQDISSPTIGLAGVTEYVFTISMGIRADFGEDPGTNDSISVGIADVTGTEDLFTTSVQRSSLNSTAFQDFSVTLPAATVETGDDIRLFVDKLAGNSLIVVDNARLDAVPEPSIALLGGLGILGLCRRRR